MQAQLQELERRHSTREAEAAELLESTRRLGALEAERGRRELAEMLERKNREVEAFRLELDAIVLDIKLMHTNHTEAAALAARAQSRGRRA